MSPFFSTFGQLAPFDLAVFNSLHAFIFNLSCLQNFEVKVRQGLGVDPLIDFVFCEVPEHRLWQDIRSVKVEIKCDTVSEASHFMDQTVAHYEKWWKSLTFFKTDTRWAMITVSM